MVAIRLGRFEAFVRFGADLFHKCGAAQGQFRMAGRLPGAGGNSQRFALFVSQHIAPQYVDDVCCARFVFRSGEPVEFASEFPWDFNIGHETSGAACSLGF